MIVAADIGGTNARLALFDQALSPRFQRQLEVAAFTGFDSALVCFLDQARDALGEAATVDAACIGVAGPVLGTRVSLTNAPWTIDADETSARLACPARLVNDFEAAAIGTMALEPVHLATVQAGEPDARGNRVVIGAGTGLGVAFCIPELGGWRVVAGEGGHVGFAPRDELQVELWRHLRAMTGRVSVEHVVSGAGIVRIHDFLRTRAPGGADSTACTDAAVVAGLAERGDALCGQALETFLRCYGACAGDYALAVLARGGVFLAGGIAPRLLDRIAGGGFIEAFRDKGPYAPLASRIPVHVVVHPDVGLLGAAVLAARDVKPRA